MSKIEKVIKTTKHHHERLQDLELAKVDVEEVMDKLADVSDIVGNNLSEIILIKDQLSFLSSLMESIGKKLDIQDPEEGSKSSDMYS